MYFRDVFYARSFNEVGNRENRRKTLEKKKAPVHGGEGDSIIYFCRNHERLGLHDVVDVDHA